MNPSQARCPIVISRGTSGRALWIFPTILVAEGFRRSCTGGGVGREDVTVRISFLHHAGVEEFKNLLVIVNFRENRHAIAGAESRSAEGSEREIPVLVSSMVGANNKWL